MIILKPKKYSFRERAPEWILAIGLLAWGIAIAANPTLFTTTTFEALLNIMPQENWAFVTIFIGILRLVALIINGAWRPTAHFRALGAVGGVTIWASLFIISLINVGDRAPGIATYGMLLTFDFLALWWAAGDAKLVDELAKSKKE